MSLDVILQRVCGGDLVAYGALVERTQRMVYAVCYRILRRHAEALDATQETYLRAFRRLGDLEDPEAFAGWLRRIAVNAAHDIARRRLEFVDPDDLPEVPILDEQESTWTESQRQLLGAALLRLSAESRRICDRFYHGGWTVGRLAQEAGVSEAAMRKRLQRIRDQLREDTQMNEQRHISDAALPADLPAKIVALLSRPKLVDLPENPVGRMLELIKVRYAEFKLVDVPEMVDVKDAEGILGREPYHLPQQDIHAVSGGRFLRYDMELPLLIAGKNGGVPLRIAATGQVYRNQTPSPMRDQTFHQFTLIWMDRRELLDPWAFMGRTLGVVSDLLPGRKTMIEGTAFPWCSSAWEVSVEVDGKWVVVLSWGVYADAVIGHLGGDPARDSAFGLEFGLERMAALHFGFSDIRMLEAAKV